MRDRPKWTLAAHAELARSSDVLSRALVPLDDDVGAHLGRKLRELSSNAGFANEVKLSALKQHRIIADLAPGRTRHGEANATERRKLVRAPLMSTMAARLERGGRRSRHRLKKPIIELISG